jgi:hypothetical protein
MRALINALQPIYTLPNRKTIGDSLLIECYNETKAEVLKNIRQNNFINVSINKSSTIIRERVINYYVIIKAKYFCMKQSAVKTELSNIKKQAKYLANTFNRLKKELKQSLPPVNSVSTDTCNTIKFI